MSKIDLLVSGGSIPHAHMHLLPELPGAWDEVKSFLRSKREKANTLDLQNSNFGLQ